MRAFIFLFLLAATNALNAKIELLKNNQGLRFEKIGEFKQITKQISLNFAINISSIDDLIQNATEHLILTEKLVEDDYKDRDFIEKLRTNLRVHEMGLQDILYGTLQKNPEGSIRRRRNAEWYASIKQSIITLYNSSNELISHQNQLVDFANSTMKFINDTIKQYSKTLAMDYANIVNTHLETKVKSIIKMLTKKRLNGEIITYAEFEKKIKNENISSQIEESQELPYSKIAEYYHNIPLQIQVDDKIIMIQMDIPLIEKSPWDLYKVTELPALNQSQLYIADAAWKYVANNSDNYLGMMSLDACYKPTRTLFYCEADSPIRNVSVVPDCAAKALITGKIDVALCKVEVVENLKLTIIKLNDGEYFFYTPELANLEIVCKSQQVQDEVLDENSVGILNLPQKCKAFVNGYTLIKMDTYEASPFIKQSIIDVSVDIAEFNKNMKEHGAPVVNKFYLDSVKSLREMSVDFKKLDHLEVPVFASTPDAFEILQYLLIVVLIMFIVYAFYNIYNTLYKRDDDLIKK